MILKFFSDSLQNLSCDKYISSIRVCIQFLFTYKLCIMQAFRMHLHAFFSAIVISIVIFTTRLAKNHELSCFKLIFSIYHRLAHLRMKHNFEKFSNIFELYFPLDYLMRWILSNMTHRHTRHNLSRKIFVGIKLENYTWWWILNYTLKQSF